jgi:hypothetical protein
MSNATKRVAIGTVLLLLWLSFVGTGSGTRVPQKQFVITVSGNWCSFGAGEQMRCSDDLSVLGLDPGSHVTIVAEAGSAGTVEGLISRLVAAGHTVTVDDG